MIPNSAHNQDLAPDDILSGVSLNYEWRQLVVPILYEGLFRYISEITDETERQTFIARVDALIDDIYTPEVATMATYHEAERTTTQAIPANTQTPVIWSTGGTSPLFSFVTVPDTGIATVSFRVKLSQSPIAIKTVFLIHNGVEHTRHDIRVNTGNQWLNLTTVLEVTAGDTFRLDVLSPSAMTVLVDDFTPKLSMVIVP